MQANVPQPTHDEDETDDVDEELKKLQVNETTALIYLHLRSKNLQKTFQLSLCNSVA